MKKSLIISILALAAASAALAADQDMTSKIVNPSFEAGSMEGWEAGGMQIQNNESPADVGWDKDGQYYAEKWVSSPNSCGAVNLCQKVEGLENGDYLLKVVGHAINQSGTPAQCSGAYIFAGGSRTAVPAFGEYTVAGTVAEGFLKIGFAADASVDANWVACDNFRLYRTGESVEGYKKYLQDLMAELDYIINDPDRPATYNKAELEAAIAAANSAQTKAQILAAIAGLRTACNNYLALKRGYSRLASRIRITEDFLAGSDYDGKAALQAVLDQAKTVYASASSTPSDLSKAVDDLKAASAAYLANRPEEWVTIKNGAMWMDTDGNPVQAHGAGFLLLNDTWYMIGEDRSKSWNPDVNMYSSKDLKTWKFERKIIQNKVTHPSLGVSRMIERPKLMYCDATGQFVVWCHWEAGNYGASEAGVFYSSVVNDPYTYHWGGRPLGVKSRDCGVFVDDDDTAYFISTTEENTNLGLFKLSDDYLDAVEVTTLFRGQRREAPAIVKYEGKYYMLSSACSGWDPNQCKLSISESLTSGWSGLKGLGNSIAFDTQPASILTIKGTKATTYLFVGDRWQDPNLPESKTIIFPISFTENGCVYQYKDQFDINFVTGEVRDTPMPEMNRENWKIHYVSSEETAKEDGQAINVLDGDYSTKWHSQWSGQVANPPHEIAVDMGQPYTLSSLIAAPRNDNSTSGIVRNFAVHVSTDGEQWQMVAGGSWYPYWSEVYFQPVEARYFKYTAVGEKHAALSEINVGNDAPAYENATGFKTYWKINSEGWRQGTNVTISATDSLSLRVSLEGLWGSWAFECPDTIMSGNQIGRAYMMPDKEGKYVAHFLDQYNRAHRVEFDVKVDMSGLETISAPAEVVAEEYYTPTGVRVDAAALRKGVYIRRTLYSNGVARTEKVLR